MRKLLLFVPALIFPHMPMKVASDIALRKGAREVYKELEAYPLSTKRRVGEGIASLGSTFRVCREMTPQEGEELVSAMVSTLLKVYNSDKELRPYLSTYPLTQNEIELMIECKSERYDEVGAGALTQIILYKGDLTLFEKRRDGSTKIRTKPIASIPH